MTKNPKNSLGTPFYLNLHRVIRLLKIYSLIGNIKKEFGEVFHAIHPKWSNNTFDKKVKE